MLVICILCTFSAKAQFKLTVNGFVDSTDNEKDFVVYTFDGESQEKLYTEVLKFINTTYKSPKDVINEVKPEMITISGFQESCISIGKVKNVLGQKMSMTGGYDLKYNISLRFKDGKIRVDAPSFECTGKSGTKTSRLVLQGSNGGFGTEVVTGLFKKSGEPSRENAIKMLEDFFNGFCISMEKSIKDKSNDEW